MRTHRPVTQRQCWWLLATAITAVAPLVSELPQWVIAGVVLTLSLRALMTWRQWHLPPRWLLVPITLAAAAGVLWYYRTLFGRTPGVALLALFLALKLLELRAARDALTVVLLAYFLVLAHFMFDQSIPAGLIAAATVIITTATLAAANDDRPPPLRLLRHSALMLLQGLPFMLALFILFPRIDGPLWGLPQDRSSAKSGLSDSMAPGTIAQLSQSDAVAFRVKFAGDVPPQQQLYWRGPVMDAFDGRTWHVAQRAIVRDKPDYAIDGKDSRAVHYELTLEPHGQSWLFALEMPADIPPDSGMTQDMQFLSSQPVRTRLRYSQIAVPGTRFGLNAPRTQIAAALALPERGNPRIRAMAQQWRRDAIAKVGAGRTATANGTPDVSGRNSRSAAAESIDAIILQSAEDFFARDLLAYTLTPPVLGPDAVDEFLFDSKKGFCEHFASAFVVAMRAAGVPARVVAGYQGGEINPVDGFLVVRQYDAHAWAEVWLQDRGWTRVDPTAITAPRRIADNFADAAPAGESLPLLARNNVAWLRDLRDQLDAVSNGWNQMVLGYNASRQREFLRNLGVGDPDWQRMTALLAALCGSMMLVLTAWILWQRKTLDPSLALWLTFTRKMARRGVVWTTWEGPQDFARRATLQRPDLADRISVITDCYIQLRFAREPTGTALRDLRRAVRSL